MGFLLAIVALLTPVVLAVAVGGALPAVLFVLLEVVAAGAARYALGRDVASLKAGVTPGTEVGEALRPVLLMNPSSGGGKVERFGLVEEARRRGVEPIVLEQGDDLTKLAEDAVTKRRADVIGMAGGDGSQALVAAVAMRHDIAYVCVPAGTRNHLAMDLGLDRDDVVGALDAFGPAVERRIDLAMIGDRVFVNNATMGLYAKIVQSPEYRDQKARTALDMLHEMIGPHAEPFDLRFTLPDGSTAPSAHLILVSNGRYQLSKPEDSVPEGASTAAPSESLPRRSATRRSWHVSSSCSPPARGTVTRAGRSGRTPLSRCIRPVRSRSASTGRR